ncbi:MAG: hypothetical protein Q4A07_01590 [Coriobacteriales bacterium]|nr:hypothetical protein [Coriobacteriales bacterium]
MLCPESTIRYLAETSSYGGGNDASFADASTYWSISSKDVSLGRIPEGITKSVFSTALRNSAGAADIQTVSVAISLRTLSALSGGHCAPLLMLAGHLDKRGRLHANPQAGSWIPLCRVSNDEYHNEDVVVCGIDIYRAHQVAMSTLPDDGSWSVAVDRAIDLFDSVNELHDEELKEQGLRFDTNRCLMCLWPYADDVRAASGVLAACQGNQPQDDSSNDKDEAVRFSMPGALARLMASDATVQDAADDGTRDLTEDALITHKLVCGIPDHMPPLTQDDQRAIATVAMQKAPDVTVLRTPKGTHAHRVSIATLANAVTMHALRGDNMPALVCVAPQEDLESMASIISSRPSAGLVALTSRWLPRIDDIRGRHVAKTPEVRRILGPLGALLMYHAQGSNIVRGNNMAACLTKSSERMEEGTATKYADPWYTPRASTYYLDCVSSFVGNRIHTIEGAAASLSELLRHVDQDRCELIDSFAEVCKAWELHKQREGVIDGIKELRKEHASCKERLHIWEELQRSNPTRRRLFGRPQRTQAALIAEHAIEGEELALGCALFEDVCAAYRARVDRIEADLDRLRGASANLTRRMQPATIASRRCSELVGRLILDCGLDQEQGDALINLLEGKGTDVTLEALDTLLDQTVRPAEFWLAIHVYEARWLELCTQSADKESLSFWGNLCPIGFVPADTSVATLHAYLGADLVVVVSADKIEVPRGMALAAMTNQLVLMGSVSSLGTSPLWGKASDELQTTEAHGYDMWHELQRSRLAVSSGVSLFDYSQDLIRPACQGLADVDGANQEILAFRNDLMPSERVRLSPSAEGHEVAGGILPPLSYVLVPDSSWAQVGQNRHNVAEASAIKRWLGNHLDEIRDEYPHITHPLAIVAPYEAQARLIRQTLAAGWQHSDVIWDVVALKDLKQETWPIVVLSATCGPTALRNEGTISARTVLCVTACAARDSVVLFCGGAWLRSAEEVAIRTMRRALRVGRLFSSPRKRTKKPMAEPVGEVKPEPDLRALPVPLPTFIATLRERGDIGRMPPASLVVQALVKVGLLEKVEGQDGEEVFRPTAAGREVGIIAITDRAGNTSCAYSNESAPVLASLIDAMDDESQDFE